MQVARSETSKKRRLAKKTENRKGEQRKSKYCPESLNAIIEDENMGYIINPVDNGASEQSLIDASINISQNIFMTQYYNLENQQKIFQHQLERFGEIFDKFDNY